MTGNAFPLAKAAHWVYKSLRSHTRPKEPEWTKTL